MRNLVIIKDHIHAIASNSNRIVSVTFDKSLSKVYLLTDNGVIFCFNEIDNNLQLLSQSYAYPEIDYTNSNNKLNNSNDWFSIMFIAGTGSLVMVSHNGSICSYDDFDDMKLPVYSELIGEIEGGIATAAWNPDQSCIVIATNNNTLLCMSSTWEVQQEISIPDRLPNSLASVSWRGDGESFALATTDSEDGNTRVRVYNRQLELLSTSRNTADGPASVMKGVTAFTAFATNGSYIAVAQERVKGKQQIALVERNGLRHGEIDLQLSNPAIGSNGWEVCSIHWDLPTSLVAVGLSCTVPATQHSSEYVIGIVQLYYRGNYHWYLKQQWDGENLIMLGFDSENLHRLYLSQSINENSVAQTSNNTKISAIRIVDIVWDICGSSTNDGSVVVIDGSRLMLTPLARNLVPPPMCKYSAIMETKSDQVEQLACKACTFWSPSNGIETVGWGLAALAYDNDTLFLFHGNSNGKIIAKANPISLNADIAAIINNSEDLDVSIAQLRSMNRSSITVSQRDQEVVISILASSTAVHHLNTDRDNNASCSPSDIVLIITYNIKTNINEQKLILKPVKFNCINELPGSVCRMISANPDICKALSTSSQQEIHRLCFSFQLNTNAATDIGSDYALYSIPLRCFDDNKEIVLQFDEIKDKEMIAALPELCSHITIIYKNMKSANIDVEDSDKNQQSSFKDKCLMMSLSLRNRLYCDETLLVAGISSFLYNADFEMLMYATLGTRPHLHFCSFDRLQALDPLQHADVQAPADCAEPRPLERGARLVATPYGDSRVVIQLPRGNLECFEPRPLIIIRAQHLINEHALFDCLVLLRKQRVDLNYLIDYRPKIFLEEIHKLVSDASDSSLDLISLLVTALEPVDTSISKYALQMESDAAHAATKANNDNILPDGFIGEEKVNKVCIAVRSALLPLLQEALDSNNNSPMYTTIVKVVQPLLCTYAQHKPSRLVEALDMIRSCCEQYFKYNKDNTTTVLSSQLCTASIKYLAFLADGSQLFDAALGKCDFEMARAVARQCQMDPKRYLPLLEQFQNIAPDNNPKTPQYSLMQYKVNIHLQRYESAADNGLQMLQILLQSSVDIDETSINTYTSTLIELRNLIEKKEIFLYFLPKINQLFQYIQQKNNTEIDNKIKLFISSNITSLEMLQSYINNNQNIIEIKYFLFFCFLNDIRKCFGDYSMNKMEYTEACSAYMSILPPDAENGIKTALISRNWILALSIAGKYENDSRYMKLSIKNNNDNWWQKQIVQGIVNEFQEELEQRGDSTTELFNSAAAAAQAQAYISMDNNDNNGNNNYLKNDIGNIHTDQNVEKVIEVARLCIDYCDDVERAVSLLTMAQKWTIALQLTIKYKRFDIQQEVATNAVQAADDLIQELPQRQNKLKQLVTELTMLWSNPEERLQKISTTDEILVEELQGGKNIDNDNMDGNINDNASDYTAATQQSIFSIRSTSSNQSLQSTGSSTLSILSNLSEQSDKTDLTNNTKKTSTFSISGLDHALLSRGNANSNPYYGSKAERRSQRHAKRDANSQRRQKRIERSKTKGANRDIWGLRREESLCLELLAYAHLESVTNAAKELVDVLMILGTTDNHILATQIQSTVSDYLLFVQNNSPPIAPHYPTKWLKKRAMYSVLYYQDPQAILTKFVNDIQNQYRSPQLLDCEDNDIESQVKGYNAIIMRAATNPSTAASIVAKMASTILLQHNNIESWWITAARGIKKWFSNVNKLSFKVTTTSNNGSNVF